MLQSLALPQGGREGGNLLKHISELMFDAILEKMLQRYSARYVALYLKKKAVMLEQECDAGTTLHRTTAHTTCGVCEERTVPCDPQGPTSD